FGTSRNERRQWAPFFTACGLRDRRKGAIDRLEQQIPRSIKRMKPLPLRAGVEIAESKGSCHVSLGEGQKLALRRAPVRAEPPTQPICQELSRSGRVTDEAFSQELCACSATPLPSETLCKFQQATGMAPAVNVSRDARD